MELGVVAAVLGAAFLHAFWNFMVRRADDKALGMASVMIGHVPLAVLALLWMGLPPLASAPYVLMSAVLHVGACFCCMPIDLANYQKFIRLPGGHRLF